VPSASNAGKDWSAIEKDLIIETLTQTRGNRSKAAEILGWGRTTLWRKLKIHGLVGSPEHSNIKDIS
ncbi:MAG: helix-turn-helix domain-containing protein, partial [Desulfobulbus sp.]|nr:helix-turn-helix domain-containing protein [Desulfobulbus sp.]